MCPPFRHYIAFLALLTALWRPVISAQPPHQSVPEEFAVAKDGDVLLLPVIFEGKRYSFALDTGSEVTVFDTSSAGLQLVGHHTPGPKAHTVAVDPATHRVFFPLPAGASGKPTLRVLRPTGSR